ncbi:hypothetical protein AOQ84DRAFT_20669 [Glonium stellatum]|uniref:Uncharacterized protein n=1 Tax=Glonium stellatum TaxID=574774 RepID=A0A8E2F3B1_9PEZI|nr:hypothetical protein AOQ84DRAFT_20669 [Glonium stellatum]
MTARLSTQNHSAARVNELRTAYLLCATCGCEEIGLGRPETRGRKADTQGRSIGLRREGPRRVVRHNKTSEIAAVFCPCRPIRIEGIGYPSKSSASNTSTGIAFPDSRNAVIAS